MLETALVGGGICSVVKLEFLYCYLLSFFHQLQLLEQLSVPVESFMFRDSRKSWQKNGENTADL